MPRPPEGTLQPARSPDHGLSARLKARALEDFGMAGIAPVRPSDHAAFLRAWLDAGYHGDMAYLARPDAVERRLDPTRWAGDLKSAVVVADFYPAEGEPADDDPRRGVIARYARGRDYHRVIKAKLRRVLRWLEAQVGRPLPVARACVDTSPVLERELARRAGLGWFGRNTMLIHPRRGSYFFIGVLLTELGLEPDAPFEADHCGTCRACLEACPTGALLGRDASGAPVMDARLCISYLTIEHRGAIPPELRPAIGNRVFGCDICQECCPFNVRFAGTAAEPGYAARGPGERPRGVAALPGEEAAGAGAFVPAVHDERVGHVAAETPADVSAETPRVAGPAHPGTSAPSLVGLMRMSRDEWDSFSRGSAIRRAGYAGFKRNVAVAMGNWLASVGDSPEEALAALRDALEDEEPLVREHAAWALGRLNT